MNEYYQFEDCELSPDDEPYFGDEYPADSMYCPVCGDGNLTYIGEQFEEEAHIGGLFKCDECGHQFNERDLMD